MKANINEYKNRLTSPIGAVRIDPKTGKAIKSKGSSATKPQKGK